MSLKVLIVGGVAGGASAAARLRRLDESAEIIMFEKGEYISFANCGLPYYIGEVIKEKEKLVVQTPEKMKERFNIDVRTNSEVVKIDRANKVVEVHDLLKDIYYSESYDRLVLSPGAEPIRPRLPGSDSPRIFTLRNIPDTYKIKEFTDETRPNRAVVVGAGFIGLEVAENLHRMGIKVTVVELADHVIGPLDFDMAALVHQQMKTKEVELYLKDAVKAFSDEKSDIVVELGSGRKLKADMVILGIGVRPESRLASDAGLKLGNFGGIAVNEYMQTSDPEIYAVGDAVEVRDFINAPLKDDNNGAIFNEGTALIPLAGPANKQGRIAADNITGRREKYAGTQGTSIVKVFDMTVALTGSNEKVLKRNGVEYEKSFTHSPSHASYYPGSIPLSIKLLFEKKDGRILGAQVIGCEGVDKRIDVLATAIRAGMTVFDLEKLELAYAPPYSSAKDPVNMAGYTASNILKGDSGIFHWDEVAGIDKEKAVLVDVRTKMEYELGTIQGAVNIPVDELRSRIVELPADKAIYLFCQVGLRGYVAARMLMQMGFASVKNLSGGYKTWHTAVQKQSNEDIFDYDRLVKDSNLKTAESGAASCVKAAEDEVAVTNMKLAESEAASCGKAAATGTAEQEKYNCCVVSDCGKPAGYLLDACGLQCPGPVMKVYDAIKNMEYGDILEVKATDPAFSQDIKSWCNRTGNKLLSIKNENRVFTAVIKKEKECTEISAVKSKNEKTMVVFSGDLDKAIATFIIANGAAAMGRKVTLFFTFWGLNVLRKTDKVSIKKDFLSKMFGIMMPRGSKKLGLSRMNMAGAGPRLIRYLMKKKNVSSLEELIEQAKANGVKLVACNMSMDLMGITRGELIEGVETGGVATMLGSAEESDMSLFI